MVVLITSSQEVTGFELPVLEPLPDFLQQAILQIEEEFQGRLLPEFSLRKVHGSNTKCSISAAKLGQEFSAAENTSPVLDDPIPLAELYKSASTACKDILRFLTTKIPRKTRRCDPLLEILALPRYSLGGQDALLWNKDCLPEPCMHLAFEAHKNTRKAVRDQLLEVILAHPCDIPFDLPSANASDVIKRPQKIKRALCAVVKDGIAEQDPSAAPQPDSLHASIFTSSCTLLAIESNESGPLTLAEPIFFQDVESSTLAVLVSGTSVVENLDWKWALSHAHDRVTKFSEEDEVMPCVQDLRALGEPFAEWKPVKLAVQPSKRSVYLFSAKESCSILGKLMPSKDAWDWTSERSVAPAAGPASETLHNAGRCAIQPVQCPIPPMFFFSKSGNKQGTRPYLTLSAFPELFPKLPVDAGHLACATDTDNANASQQQSRGMSPLWALVAKEMMPDDGCYMLPPIDLSASDCFNNSVAKGVGGAPRHLTVRAALAESRIALTMGTVGDAIYLDWGLSTNEASLRPVELLDICKKTAAQLYSGPVQVSVPSRDTGARCSADVVLHNLLDSGGCKNLLGTHHNACATPLFKASPTLDGPGGALECRVPAEDNPSPPPPAKRPRRERAAGNLQFFAGLQNQNLGSSESKLEVVHLTADQGGEKNTEPEMSEGMPSPPQRGIQRIETSLSSDHAALFEQLRQEDASLMSTVPFDILPTEVKTATFPDVDAIGAFLRSRFDHGGPSTAPKRETPMETAVARGLGGMAVCRQAAALLLHHGVRSAGLYIEASIRELPGVLGACRSLQAVQAAAGKVEAGEGEDHPKHTALRQCLMSMSTLIPGAKHLVIGDPKSFFSLYSVIRAAGLCPCHLDPSGQLLAAGADASAVREAIVSACQQADCVLVAADLLTCSSQSVDRFPLDMFQHAVVYATERDMQQSVLASLDGVECNVTLLEVVVPATPTKRMEERPRSRIQTRVNEHHATVKSAAAHAADIPTPALDWPLVVSSSPERPIKKRTALYEGLLGLERSGTVIIERLMQRIDLVLSPSAALVVVLCKDEQPEFENFYNNTSETLQRASYSFTNVFFVCEGNAAFRAQVLCGMPRLLALAAGFGVILQCDVTTDSSSTAAAIQTIAKAHLEDWKNRKTGRHYTIGDPASPQEFFLERFPSLNAHSAAVLARCGLSLQEVLCLDSLPPGKVTALLGLVPTHSMELFVKCATFGDRLVGAGPVGVGVERTDAREKTGADWGMELRDQQHADENRQLQVNAWQRNEKPPPCDAPPQAKRPRMEAHAEEQAPAPMMEVAADGDGDERAAYAAWLQQQHQEEAQKYQQHGFSTDFQGTVPPDIQGLPDLACLEDFLADDAGCGSEATSSPSWQGGPLGGYHPPPGPRHSLQRPGPSPLSFGAHRGMHHAHVQPQHAQHAQQLQQRFYPAQSGYTTAPAPPLAPSQGHYSVPQRAYGNNEVDEFGMPLDPSVIFQVDVGSDEDEVSMNNTVRPRLYGGGQRQRMELMEEEQQLYGDQRHQHEQMHTVSAYAAQVRQQGPPAVAGCLFQQQQQQHFQQPPHTLHSEYGYAQHKSMGYPPPTRDASMYQPAPNYHAVQQPSMAERRMPSLRAEEIRPLAQHQAPWQRQQQQQPSVGGARGYTAAALNSEQAPTQGGLTSPPGSAGYMRRKWGAARGKGRRGGGKFTSRTSRQW